MKKSVHSLKMIIGIKYRKIKDGDNVMGAYPGSEFVVANTLAKWKKLEPNEINFSQGFSQKVSTSCFCS